MRTYGFPKPNQNETEWTYVPEPTAPGLKDAVMLLDTTRRQLGMKDLVATWTTEHGLVQLTIDNDGHQVFVDGAPVPTNP